MIGFESTPGPQPWLTPSLESVPGDSDFARQYAGARTEVGLYRVHDAHSGAIASQSIPVAFPDFVGYTAVFGQDWLGRQFGFAPDRVVDGGPGVLLFELSTGSVLELPFNLDTFHQAYDSDLAVYLWVTAQIWNQVRDLPDGTTVSGASER